MLLLTCRNISLPLDNALLILNLEVKPAEVPSELVSQITRNMMERNRKEMRKIREWQQCE